MSKLHIRQSHCQCQTSFITPLQRGFQLIFILNQIVNGLKILFFNLDHKPKVVSV